MNNSAFDGAVLFVGCASRPAELQAHIGHPVVEAATLDEAVSQLRQDDISCVVSEYHLEDGTALELLDAIRDDFPTLPFLLWTADGNEKIASRAISAGVTDYIMHDGELDNHAIDRILTRIKEVTLEQPEATVHREQRLFDRLLETCPTGITVVDADGDISLVNDRAEDILGITREEILDRVFTDPAWEIIDWDGNPIPDDELPARRVQETGEAIYGGEIGVKRPDGECTWLRVNSVPVSNTNHDSSRQRVVNAFEDVTDHRKYQRQLEENERKFRAVFEEAFDAMLIANDETEYVDVNPPACELFGLDREELLGRSISEFAADDYDFDAAWREFQESDQDSGLFPLVRVDGEERIVEFAATPDILPGRHLSVLRDVTDRQEAKEQLQEERDRAQRYLDTAGVMMVALETDGKVTLANETACDLLGREESEIVGRDWFDTFVPVSDRAETRAGFEELMADNIEQVEEFENAVLTADGEKRIIEWHNTVLRDDEGEVIGTLSSGTDVTERKHFEETLTALYDSAHELLGTETKDEVSEVIVDTVTDILDISGVMMYLYDGEEELLYPSVQSGEAAFMREEFPEVPPDNSSITGHVYANGETHLYDDITESPYIQTDATDMRAGIFVPLGTQGILIVGSQEVGAFDEQTLQLVELLGANAKTVYNRVEHLSQLRERERELKASEEKFRSLVEAAPDPIFVANAETGEIIETNTAACNIRQESRDEILGLHQTALHPEEDADRYKALFERHIEQNDTVRQFPDGSPVLLTTPDDERIPVAISTQTVHLGERTLIHGIFRDISEQKRYETSLEKLNHAAQDFLAAETDHEIARTAVEFANDVLGFAGVAVYFYDEDDGVLTPAAYPAATEDLLGELPTFSPGDSIAWRVYTSQEPALFDDVRSDGDVYNPGTPIRSELVIPLGEHGVFLAGDPEIGVFDDQPVDLADILTTTAEAALDRIDWTQQLQEQEREAQLHARRLERVDQINEKIRSIIQAIVHVETRPDIEQAICDALVEIDRFEFAWIGIPDFVGSELQPSSWAGTTKGYLESISLDLDSDRGEPSLTAAQQRETTVVSNIAGSLQQESWRQDALLEDFRSVISIPILHDEVLYGVLSIYGGQPETFDDRSTAVLTDLGELIGYALNAVERRSAFHETGVVELTFELLERDDLFITLASRLAADIEIRNITPRSDDSYLVYLLTQDIDPDRFRDEVSNFTTISEVRSIGDAESGQFELIVSDSCLATDAAEFAPLFHSITITEQDSRISITLPQDRDARRFIAQLRGQYPDITLVGRQDTERESSSLGPSSLLDHLTPRQQEVLKAAYYGGFFDQPRKSTGLEIADSLGISQPAFSKQLRKSERNLLKPLYEPE